MPLISAECRCSRTGREEGVGREDRSEEIAGSSWWMTCIIDIIGRYGSQVATYKPCQCVSSSNGREREIYPSFGWTEILGFACCRG